MKKCPNCGTMNFSNVLVCTSCKANIEGVKLEESSNTSNPSVDKLEGMSWVWAWLLMQAISYVLTLLVGEILKWYIQNNALQALSSDTLTGYLKWVSNVMLTEYVLNVTVVIIALIVWIKLTNKRYFFSGGWIAFTYLWFVTTPIFAVNNSLKSYSNMANIDSSWTAPWTLLIIFCIAFISAGVIGFYTYRKRKETS